MRIIISPAKKMKTDTDSLPPESLPQFLSESSQLLHTLRKMDIHKLKTLWGCNDVLAQLNFERIQSMNLEQTLTPAILAYEGIQYQYMAPSVFENRQLAYVGEHLRILSGFYGLLRPFDGVKAYRLEMQAKLTVGKSKNLYDFWGTKLADQLCTETDFILNLASKEYSRAVSGFLPAGIRFLNCAFAESKDGRIIEKGTMCKIARGEMVRWLAENRITTPESMKDFHRLGYTYSSGYSNQDKFVFLKGES